ncbi:MAG TPA: ABC transporter substrate-binding protein [Allocoleopsis sp.]
MGVTALSEVWLQQNLHRFQLCFSGRDIRKIRVENGKFFADLQALKFDALINGLPAYREKHHCTRLTTHHLLLVAFGSSPSPSKGDWSKTISSSDINFADVVLLEEVYQELTKHQGVNLDRLKQAVVLNHYEQLLEFADKNKKLSILPDFCCDRITTQQQISTQLIQGLHEYGVYMHVPHFGELLVSGESLVRSFRLDENNLETSTPVHLIIKNEPAQEENVIRVGFQRDSLGQIIAAYGTKYISDLFKRSVVSLDIKNVEIDRSFDLKIIPFASGNEINKQMKRGELDICILDDVSLLNNGFCFFNDLSFGSKLIGIASYNLLGQDISIVLPQKSQLNSVYDLRGKRIATLFGSNAHRFIITLFDLYGMDVSQDCKLMDEDPRTAATSLLSESIDAYVCCSTFASILTEHIPTRELSQDPALHIKLPSLRGIVCRSQFIKENPKFVIAYLHDLVIANYWFTANSGKAIAILSQLLGISKAQITQFFNPASGSRIDPTLKPQWSWLLKTLNRRLNGKYNISLFDVDFWIEDYFLRLVYNLLELDYHFQQISFSSELSNSYFVEEKFNRYMRVIDHSDAK